MPTIQPSGLLLPREAVLMAHVGRETLVRWADAGKLTVIWTPGGQRRYLEAEIRALPRRGTRADRERLTDEVARLTRSGLTAAQVAGELGLSTRVVTRHRTRARVAGLLPPDPRAAPRERTGGAL